jgi:hypothetical protein
MVLLLIVLTGIGSPLNNYFTSRKAAKQHDDDQTRIAALRKAVETANKNQEDNTKQFVDAFGKLSRKVGDLQTQVATEDLQKKLSNVQRELQQTQKALAPAPKAKLLFTFLPYDRGQLGVRFGKPSTEVTLPVEQDGSVHVEFTVLNATRVEARDGEYDVIVCDVCSYAKEPEGFKKLAGRPERERYFGFARLGALADLPSTRIDVVVPKDVRIFEIGIMYRCATCEIPQSNEGLSGTIHVRDDALGQ